MKRIVMFGLAFAAGLFATAARADVDVHIGIGVPGVVIGTHGDRHHGHFHPPPRHRHVAPPVYFFPDEVYRRPHKHYGHKHLRPARPPMDHHLRHGIRPPRDQHLRHGHRPMDPHFFRGHRPPPHAHARGHWHR